VHPICDRLEMVGLYGMCDGPGGGWGATRVRIKKGVPELRSQRTDSGDPNF